MTSGQSSRHPFWRIADALLRLSEGRRRLVVVAVHLTLIVLSNLAALMLRFDGQVPAENWTLALRLLPLLLAVRALTFVPFRLYQGLWRYTSVNDVRDIVASVAASSVTLWVLVRWVLQLTLYPRSVYVIDGVLLIGLMCGIRMLRRMHRDSGLAEGGKRVLVYGAGDAGEMIVRDMKRHATHGYDPIGFVDDNRAKVGQRIHGVAVLGTGRDLDALIRRHNPDELLIAMPRIDPVVVRGVVKALEPFKIPLKTLPSLRDIVDGKVSVSQIRSLAIGDLLPRAPIGLNPAPVRALIEGRTVLVTGAGGSIGSELCRQILTFGPRALVFYERYENSLFELANSVIAKDPQAPIFPVVGDVRDWDTLNQVLGQHRPDVIFHAAAHKHVPLMQLNPCEAVKNNVAGAWTLATLACRHNVQRVVFISTDKAVNPTSVMGATKRVTELIAQAFANGGAPATTCFSVVRFGNVLGSNGSVVPTFLKQIDAGGPVTVTHADIRRYFMLIPEAVQLVLHAAAQAEGGEVFVLDMGEQIKLVDLARNLIRLAGFVPDVDIPITFTGLRPGEKLYEELVGVAEEAEPTAVAQILRIRQPPRPDLSQLRPLVLRLLRVAAQGDMGAAFLALRQVVPTFAPTTGAVPEPSSQFFHEERTAVPLPPSTL